MKKSDLHLHTFYSDGEYSPDFVADEIKKNNINVFSITDHNYIAQEVKDLRGKLQGADITFIEGIEVSCIDKKRNISIHMLGYSKDFDISINQSLKPIVDGYNTRAKNIIQKVNAELSGINLDFDKIHSENKEVYTSRNTLAREVSQFIGGTLTMREILKKYVFVPEDDSWMFSAQEVVSIIKEKRGKAFIAHSGRILSKIGKDEYIVFIKELIDAGLDGIEVYYPSHTELEFKELKKIAEDYNLMMSGGSDWHGYTYTPNKQLGYTLPSDTIDTFLSNL